MPSMNFRNLENYPNKREFLFYWYGEIAGICDGVPSIVARLDGDKDGEKLFIISCLPEGSTTPCGGLVVKNRVYQGLNIKKDDKLDFMIFKIIYPD